MLKQSPHRKQRRGKLLHLDPKGFDLLLSLVLETLDACQDSGDYKTAKLILDASCNYYCNAYPQSRIAIKKSIEPFDNTCISNQQRSSANNSHENQNNVNLTCKTDKEIVNPILNSKTNGVKYPSVEEYQSYFMEVAISSHKICQNAQLWQVAFEMEAKQAKDDVLKRKIKYDTVFTFAPDEDFSEEGERSSIQNSVQSVAQSNNGINNLYHDEDLMCSGEQNGSPKIDTSILSDYQLTSHSITPSRLEGSLQKLGDINKQWRIRQPLFVLLSKERKSSDWCYRSERWW